MAVSDRRRYFRISDMVGLGYRPLGEGDSTTASTDVENVQIAAAQLLKSIDNELSVALKPLWQNSPATANAIGLINKKLDIIASELDIEYAGIKGLAQDTVRVNISACGMAFECNDRFNPEQRLELQITLKPTGSRLTLVGRVVSCERTGESSKKAYRLRIEFEDLETYTQEQLIQHIVKRQSSLLSEQRSQQRSE